MSEQSEAMQYFLTRMKYKPETIEEKIAEAIKSYFWAKCNCDHEGLCDPCIHKQAVTQVVDEVFKENNVQ